MNQLTIIGNLTRDPERRDTDRGAVVSFTVAVSRRGDANEADYVRVSAWNQLGENCYKYLAKGKKVACVGTVRAHGYTDNHGESRGALEMTAREVEFLTPRGQASEESQETDGEDDDELPF